MRIARSGLVAATTAVALGLLSACGDDGDGGGGDDFIADADAICQAEAEQINQLFTELGNPTGPEELAALLEERIPLAEQTIVDMKALEPPEDSSEDFETFISGHERRSTLLQEEQQAASRAEEPEVRRVEAEIAEVDRRNTRVAAEIGFEACSGRLPEDEQEEVRTVLQDIASTGDPAHCTEDYTENFVESAGTLEDCRKAESDQAAQADSVEIGFIGGVSETSASADVTFSGGANDGKTLTHLMVYAEGRWKLDGLVEAPPEG